MTNRQPPKLATAFLRWFGPDSPALAGDLLERYRSGESRWWFWREVIAAIATTNDRALIARGVIVGWVTLRVFWLLVGSFNQDIMGTRVLDSLIVSLGSHPFVMFYAVVFWYRPIALLGFVLSGWVVARLHRPCAIMAVFVFLTTVLVRQGWVQTANWMHSLQVSGHYPSYPAWEIGFTVLMPFGIVLGAAIARSHNGAAVSPYHHGAGRTRGRERGRYLHG
jgi:hypothetical protein